MSLQCDICGYRNNEIKGGGEIPKKGKTITLNFKPTENNEDLKRDLLKSDTCIVLVPELELEITQGSLGGLYTTVII